jgi:hypothetical protein
VSDIYQVGHLERVPLGTLCPGIVAHVRRLLGKLPNAAPIIDYTGVGRPVFGLFTAAGISPVGVLITGGAVETHDGPIYGVPKLTLVSRLQALLHEGRLKIHKELSEAETLVRELQDFRVEFTAAGHLTFNARSGRHDGSRAGARHPAVWHAHGGMATKGEEAQDRKVDFPPRASAGLPGETALPQTSRRWRRNLLDILRNAGRSERI